MDVYHPFQVRTQEGGGENSADGQHSAADPTNEPDPNSNSPSPLAVVAATLIVIYFVAMFFFGLIYYTGISTAFSWLATYIYYRLWASCVLTKHLC